MKVTTLKSVLIAHFCTSYDIIIFHGDPMTQFFPTTPSPNPPKIDAYARECSQKKWGETLGFYWFGAYMYLYAFLGFMTGAESLGFEPGSSPKYAHGLTHLPIMPCYEYFSSILVLLTNILHCYRISSVTATSRYISSWVLVSLGTRPYACWQDSSRPPHFT